MRDSNRRLKALEGADSQKHNPPTLQVIFYHWDNTVRALPIQPAPHGNWQGLQKLIVEYTHQWRPEPRNESEETT